MITVEMLQADHGDAFWIRYGQEHQAFYNLIVDGGTTQTGETLEKIMKKIQGTPNEKIDAIILTHIDDDHMMGLSRAFQKMPKQDLDSLIGKIYFNTSNGIKAYMENPPKDSKNFEDNAVFKEESTNPHKLGTGHAISFRKLLQKCGLEHHLVECTKIGDTIDIPEATVTVISPDQEQLEQLVIEFDNYRRKKLEAKAKQLARKKKLGSTKKEEPLTFQDLSVCARSNLVLDEDRPANISSIAFIMEYEGKRLAFLGDARADVCMEGLKKYLMKTKGTLPYRVDLMKVSHHGSPSSNHDDLFLNMPTDYYMISTNGGQVNTNSEGKHPNKNVLAHIAELHPKKAVNLIVNYKWWITCAKMKNFFSDNDKKEYLDTGRISLIHTKEIPTEGLKITDGLYIHGNY